MPSKDDLKDLQTKVRLPRGMVKAVDDYRFENRLSSRNQAIVDLLSKGVAAHQATNTTNHAGNGQVVSDVGEGDA